MRVPVLFTCHGFAPAMKSRVQMGLFPGLGTVLGNIPISGTLV